ncbi:MAG TPA: hypothetical protein VGX48_08165 [Pyrinomonadaceae bacterium]|jgi:hypothetical protein|nr:hypothetical protein [Pyrinomonadaceae bacterium]
MTKREPKEKVRVPTRSVKPKGNMFQNLRRPEEVEAISIEELVAPSVPAATTPASEVALDHLRPPEATQGTLRPPKAETVAPVRDFNKRANVLDRDALPSGLFPGSSKKLYDALYIRTLGAVVPSKTIQATRRELGEWSGIRNVKTIAAHLRHLETVGLVLRGWDRGDNEGSVYEVRLPDGLRPPKTTQGDLRPPEVALDQNSVLPLGQISALGGLSQPIENQSTSGDDKTSFKTNTEKTDDEAFADLVALLGQASREVTGRESTASEAGRWKEVAELLATELKVAASRTSVTSAPAFLAEHLRRRLRKSDARQIEKEVGEASSRQPAGTSKPELSPEQIQEQVNLMVGLITGGAEMRELEEQFSANFRPAQWHMIRSIALAQADSPTAKPHDSEK